MAATWGVTLVRWVEGDEGRGQWYARAAELPLPPVAGLRLALPGEPEALEVLEVTVTAGGVVLELPDGEGAQAPWVPVGRDPYDAPARLRGEAGAGDS